MLTDKEIIDGILIGNKQITHDFFFVHCQDIFDNIRRIVFKNRIEKDALISELCVYLKENNWYRLRQFHYRYTLISWVSIIARNYFAKNEERLKQQISPDDITEDAFYTLIEEQTQNEEDTIKAELTDIINLIANERYRFVLIESCIKGRKAKDIAGEMGINLNNFYNLQLRALEKFKPLAKKYW